MGASPDVNPDAQAVPQTWSMGIALPGLTVPWGHALYLWLATAVSLGVHEVRLSSFAGASIRVLCMCSLQSYFEAIDTGKCSKASEELKRFHVCAGM